VDNIKQNSDNPIFNISSHLRERAALHPFRRAVVYPSFRDDAGRVAYSQLTFAQLDQESDRLAQGLNQIGITRGARTILMVRPGIDFFILTFALFKSGAIPVMVDPGMGIRRMLLCLKESDPSAFIGIPKAHLLRSLYPKYFTTVKTWVTVGKRWCWGGHSYRKIMQRALDKPYPTARTRVNDPAAILFTTGSTGPAKGAVYTHGTFDAQIRHIQSYFEFGEDEIDLPTFPLFALFDPALGITAVIPDMDPTRPALVNPEKIIEAINNQGVTNMFASPALLNRVGLYAREKNLTLTSLRRVVCAGAPARPADIERFCAILTADAQVHTPYGATEAVPVLAIGSREILSETADLTQKGYGMCVGRSIADLEVKIIKITDGPIESWSDDLVLDFGEIGEIAVKGDLVSRQYFNRPKADALAKIRDNQGDIWHRMGDLGWQDNKERIWFCGRKSHRVITENGDLFTIPCEAIFNTHPAVFRSALVGIGKPPNQTPVILIEVNKKDQQILKNKLKQDLLALGGNNVLTETIDVILFHDDFPVDIRHNSKIFREDLARWAQKKLIRQKDEKKKPKKRKQ
jgi:olefin beta-lactone synthetase